MEPSKHSNRKVIGFAGIALALLALSNVPGASAAAVVIPNGTGCIPNDTFTPAGNGEVNCVIATGRCVLTIVVTDGTTTYLYQKMLFVTQTWIVLVNVPIGFSAGASCPPPN